MRENSILNSILGLREWKKLIKGCEDTLIIIIPKGDTRLLLCLPEALDRFLKRSNEEYNQIKVYYTYDKIEDIEKQLNLINQKSLFIPLEEKRMNRLLSYIALTYDQIGFIQQRNIKIISLDEQFAGQLRALDKSGIVSLQLLIEENMLYRGK